MKGRSRLRVAGSVMGVAAGLAAFGIGSPSLGEQQQFLEKPVLRRRAPAVGARRTARGGLPGGDDRRRRRRPALLYGRPHGLARGPAQPAVDHQRRPRMRRAAGRLDRRQGRGRRPGPDRPGGLEPDSSTRPCASSSSAATGCSPTAPGARRWRFRRGRCTAASSSSRRGSSCRPIPATSTSRSHSAAPGPSSARAATRDRAFRL